MNSDQQLFIDALRSGTYSQGFFRLHDPVTDCYCALGVAHHALGEGVETLYSASPVVTTRLRLYTSSGRSRSGSEPSIMMMNDHHDLTFAQIADRISINPDRYFRPEALHDLVSQIEPARVYEPEENHWFASGVALYGYQIIGYLDETYR